MSICGVFMLKCFYSSVIVSLLLSGCLIVEAKDAETKTQKESDITNKTVLQSKKSNKTKSIAKKAQEKNSSLDKAITSDYKEDISFLDAAKTALEKGFTLAKSKTDYMTA